jgi:hypothetical protein
MNDLERRRMALDAAVHCIPQQSWSVELSDTTARKILLLAHCFDSYLLGGYEDAMKTITDKVGEYRDKRRSY